MFEKCNPMHPDKIADRIAGALVDYAYTQEKNPRIAVEVLIGHGQCFIISETSVSIPHSFVVDTVHRISKDNRIVVIYQEHPQDIHLSFNQVDGIRCGDNGIFRGVPITEEQMELSEIARELYNVFPTDGKYIIETWGESEEHNRLIICQSNALKGTIETMFPDAEVNPLGYWTGGTDVDTGATNRKLGSDMADSVTGGGLHGKDLSKADVSVNIYAWLKAQKLGFPVEICCAIGDEFVDGKPYSEIVEIARDFIEGCGGFEKFAEWGLV